MKKPEDQNLAWFLFKSAFQAFFITMMWAGIALLDEDAAVEGMTEIIEELKNDSE